MLFAFDVDAVGVYLVQDVTITTTDIGQIIDISIKELCCRESHGITSG